MSSKERVYRWINRYFPWRVGFVATIAPCFGAPVAVGSTGAAVFFFSYVWCPIMADAEAGKQRKLTVPPQK